MTVRRAAFLDRDGTLIEDSHYLAEPDDVRLIPGAAVAVRRLNAAGVVVVVVTNQSGIAQGLITASQYEATRVRIHEAFAAEGAHLEASYHCPHHPAVSGACECRKPGVALYLDAARDLGLDLASSAYVGDRRRDVEPALVLGGTGVLVPSPGTPGDDVDWAREHALVAPTLEEAVEVSGLDRAGERA